MKIPGNTCRPAWTTTTRVTAFLSLMVLFLGACSAPISARRVSPREAHAQVATTALITGKPGAATAFTLRRYGLDRMAASHPDEAVRKLHEQAMVTGDRDLLFALAELSYAAGDRLTHIVKPWDTRDARDYFLGSAFYAWLFLFGDSPDPKPGIFDRRFRQACDFYNTGLGLALTQRYNTNGVVRLATCRRRLPVGEVMLTLTRVNFDQAVEDYEQILLADQFAVQGLSARNRAPGLGAPLICVEPLKPQRGFRASVPATVLLRGPDSLKSLVAGGTFSLELHSSFEETEVCIGGVQVPLETDLTAYRAYTLTQSRVWTLGKLGFLAPAERIPSQLIMNQPFEPDRIPVVFVHGTFSSPVTWAEMANSLIADPVLRRRYQLWSFIYGSGNPLVQSIADFRAALAARIQELDPQGTNSALRRMVVIGHSQGGLLTKSAAVDTGDRLWRVFSTNNFEMLEIPESKRDKLRKLLFLKPLPFVKRVVFIATPHRGSYLSGGLARSVAQRVVSLPGGVVARGNELVELMKGSETGRFLNGKMPTSLDGMSPKNPALLAMAEIPVAPQITAHSIIPIRGDGDPHNGKDGVVAYASAHADYVESEFIVHSGHSCLNQPATIEEVRRILHHHLEQRD